MFDTLVQPQCTQTVLHSVMLTTPEGLKNKVKCVFVALVQHLLFIMDIGFTKSCSLIQDCKLKNVLFVLKDTDNINTSFGTF